MTNGVRLLGLLGVALFFSLHIVSAQAQATRTWVSGVGDDVNPCSRTAPCKTFAGAISKTAAGGEISVLDPGGYGGVTITKAISITNDSVGEASILVAGTNGITVSAGSQDVVRIHGIIIDGGNALTSLAGIRFNTGGELHVENCLIKNFQAAGTGFGIQFTNSTPANLYVSDTVIVHNVNGQGGGGILIKPTSNGGVKAVLNRVQSYNNLFGLKVDGTTSTNQIRVTVTDSVMSDNLFHGIWGLSTGAESDIEAVRTTMVNNQLNGALIDGNKASITIAQTTITANNTGISAANGGFLYSFNNNYLNGNTTNGTIPPGNILPPS